MKNNKVKNILLLVLTIGLVTMTVAYATYISQLLIRDNEIRVKNDRWDIHFDNGRPTRVIGGAKVVQEPTLTATLISGLRVNFVKLGDGIVYTFDIKNEGTINASLSSIIKSNLECTSSNQEDADYVCSNINYKLVYTDTNEEVSVGNTLDAGQTKTVSLIVDYKNTTGERTITEDVIIRGFDVVFNYVQY
ncbi:MAG: hypothetical protein IJJ47_10745 [Methanosphaera sp.]|nr:hypothetical protein [Methanosphaera sp.]